jgi:DNA-binding PadR family transcriptional regulator
MANVLRSRGKDQDMPIKWGSLYTVVGNLEKHGLIEAAGRERSGARPERTVYQITDAGREELTDWVGELLGTPERERPRFEPRVFLVEDEYDLAIRTAELHWLDGLLAELTAGTLPGLDLWQSWHDTGEVPAELTELAQRGRNP